MRAGGGAAGVGEQTSNEHRHDVPLAPRRKPTVLTGTSSEETSSRSSRLEKSTSTLPPSRCCSVIEMASDASSRSSGVPTTCRVMSQSAKNGKEARASEKNRRWPRRRERVKGANRQRVEEAKGQRVKGAKTKKTPKRPRDKCTPLPRPCRCSGAPQKIARDGSASALPCRQDKPRRGP